MARIANARHLLLLAVLLLVFGCAKESDDRAESAAPVDHAQRPVETNEVQPFARPSDPAPSVAPAPEAMPQTSSPHSLPPVEQPAYDLQPSVAPRSYSKQSAPEASAMQSAPRQVAPRFAPQQAQPFRAESRPAEMSAPPEAMSSEQTEVGPLPATESPSEQQPVEQPAAEQSAYEVVQVFYATDRNAYTQELSVLDASQRGWLVILLGAALAMILAAAALLWRAKRVALGFAALLVAVASGGVYCLHESSPRFASPEILMGEAEQVVGYGGDRGQLHLGVCEVSIPPQHEVGKLESPSILRFEFKENPEKHVVLLSIERREDEDYFTQLSDTIAASEHGEALVFVHGFNVSFDDAVRRTAQIAHDLRFQGAPICYSWPSQAQTIAYTVDENNVVWTVPHLKQFLLDVVQRTGAKSINLVAHSMGNRALTSAVRELSYELRPEKPLFNEIVLAAPDVDAEVFQRDLAPVMAQAGKRVTLYASSNDQALAASRAVHGYPRAGETGNQLVVVPGIDTIDVSAIDTSLLGHSYYGDSSTLLYDMHSVIRLSLPPEQRPLLQQQLLQSGLQFWVFQPPYGPVARPTAENLNR